MSSAGDPDARDFGANGERSFVYCSRRELDNDRFRIVSRRGEAPPVVRQKGDHGRGCGALVAVEEWMVAANMKCVRRSHRRNVLVEKLTFELLRGLGDGGFQKSAIANGRVATLVFDRDSVEDQDVINRQESRGRAHLGSLRISSPFFAKTFRT
jgi:hypothetical protein